MCVGRDIDFISSYRLLIEVVCGDDIELSTLELLAKIRKIPQEA